MGRLAIRVRGRHPRRAAILCLLGIAPLGAMPHGLVQATLDSDAAGTALSPYFIADRRTEIELARSAAPASVSSHAEVLVLTPDGYASATKGDNGFVCLVERSWGKTTDDPEFRNARIKAPICVNASAARSYLPVVLIKTRLAVAGRPSVEIARAVNAALDTKEIPPLEPNAMCYMMSKQQYLGDADRDWLPHMMWFVAGDAVQSWQANQPGVPVIAGHVPEDRMTVFMVPVGRWSDGTPVTPVMH